MTGLVLIVEDDSEVCEVVVKHLRAGGHEVVSVATEAAARDALEVATCDVIVLASSAAPGSLGSAVAGLRDRAPDTEVIVAAQEASLEIALECLRACACDLVPKPYHLATLSAAVLRACERRRLRQSTALYQTCQVIFSAPVDGRLAQRVVDAAIEVMGADEVSLMLLDPAGRLHVAHASGDAGVAAAGVTLGPGERIAGRALLERTPIILNGPAARDPRFAGVAERPRIRSSIIYPLFSHNRALGVLNLARVAKTRPFRPEDLERVAALASQVVLALENEELVHRVMAAERLATVGTIAAGVGHEINNPVSYVLNSGVFLAEQLVRLNELQLLIDGMLADAPIRRWWEKQAGRGWLDDVLAASHDVEEGARRIRDIARDLGNLARAESDPPRRTDLNKAISAALRIAGAELRQHAIVDVQLAPEGHVRGNTGKLSQVFINLLVNAAQAVADQPADRRQITVSSRVEDGRVVAEVADSGSGIRPEHVPRLFEPFFTTKGTVGTGLGLSISRDIVRGYGGDMGVTSAVGQGTAVRVELPIAAAAGLPSPKAAEPSSPSDHRRLRLLLVDDEPAILRTLERSLGKHHEVLVARTGEEALRLLSSPTEFDLVFCDLLMPSVTGMELYARILALHPHLAESFVFMTGSGGMREVDSFLRAAGRPVLEKPLDLAAIRRLIAARASRRSPPEPSRAARELR